MSQSPEEKKNKLSSRRVFFGQLLIAAGGGIFGGSLMQRLHISPKVDPRQEGSVTITANPLAIPRTKEGSKPNV